MNKRIKTLIMTAIILCSTVLLSAQSAEDIIRTMDDLQSFDSMKATGSMITNDRFGTKKVDYISWSEGNDNFIIEFTSAAELGQKILRTSNELFLYYPDAEEIIRLQGAALRQSMMGSDISYEDMTEGNDTLSKYDVELVRSELVDGQDCYVIEMTAKSRKVPYPRQTLWVVKDTFVPEQVHYFSKSGKLLKEMRVLEVRDFDGQIVISKMVLEDKLKKNSSTEMIVDQIETNPNLGSGFFSLDQLAW